MRAAFDGVDVVDEREHGLGVAVVVLQRDLDRRRCPRSRDEVDRLRVEHGPCSGSGTSRTRRCRPRSQNSCVLPVRSSVRPMREAAVQERQLAQARRPACRTSSRRSRRSSRRAGSGPACRSASPCPRAAARARPAASPSCRLVAPSPPGARRSTLPMTLRSVGLAALVALRRRTCRRARPRPRATRRARSRPRRRRRAGRRRPCSVSLSNLPPACSMVMTTSSAGRFFLVACRSTGMPRPLSTTVIDVVLVDGHPRSSSQ